jgi:Protein of unknown function (DUF4235)
MGLIYKPIGIALGLGAASLGRLLFGKLWGIFDDEEPPEPLTRETDWPKLLFAAAVQGVIFRIVRVSVDRFGAIGWHKLTGNWPGEERPDPR